MHEVLRPWDEPPSWLIGLLREIDTLQFGPEFERFIPDADLMFGAMHVKGIANIKALFVRLMCALATEHRVHEFWSGRRSVFFRGEVEMSRKNDASQTIVAPIVQFFVMSGRRHDRIERVQILVGPMGFDLQ